MTTPDWFPLQYQVRAERRKNPPPKPLIRRHCGMWLCSHYPLVATTPFGMGPTPQLAYHRWRVKMLAQAW